MHGAGERVDEAGSGSVAALVAEARAEQSRITSKLSALRSDLAGDPPGSVGPKHCLAEPEPAPPATAPVDWGVGAELHAASGHHEKHALRQHLAELDSELLERDAVIDGLKAQVAELQRALARAKEEPEKGGLWRERYEEAQRAREAHEQEANRLRQEGEARSRELAILGQYVRKLEGEAKVRDSHRERLLSDAELAAERCKALAKSRDEASARIEALEEGFARCVARVTRSAAAGVVAVALVPGVAVGAAAPVERFAVLGTSPGGGALLELFEEPDSAWEVAAVALPPREALEEGCVTASRGRLSVALVGELVGGHLPGLAADGRCTAQISCADVRDYEKWAGSLRLLQLLPWPGSAEEKAAAPALASAPGGPPADGQMLRLLAAVEGDRGAQERLEARLAARACCIYIRLGVEGADDCQRLRVLQHARALLDARAWTCEGKEEARLVRNGACAVIAHCEGPEVALRVALRVLGLCQEFPSWLHRVAPGIRGSIALSPSVGIEVGKLLLLRSDCFGAPVLVAKQMAEELAQPWQIVMGTLSCQAACGDSSQQAGLAFADGRSRGSFDAPERRFAYVAVSVQDPKRMTDGLPQLPGPEEVVRHVKAVGGCEPERQTAVVLVAALGGFAGMAERRGLLHPVRLALRVRDIFASLAQLRCGRVLRSDAGYVVALFPNGTEAAQCAAEAMHKAAALDTVRQRDGQICLRCTMDGGEVQVLGSEVIGRAAERSLFLAEKVATDGQVLVTKSLREEAWRKAGAEEVEVSGEKRCEAPDGLEDNSGSRDLAYHCVIMRREA